MTVAPPPADDLLLAPELRSRLEAAAAGVIYGSEGDHPFEFFALPGAAPVPPAREFARLVGAAPTDRVDERSWEQFVAWPLAGGDPADPTSAATAAAYARLDTALRDALRDIRVIRVGQVQVRCWVVGDDGHGNLAGVVTTAIET